MATWENHQFSHAPLESLLRKPRQFCISRVYMLLLFQFSCYSSNFFLINNLTLSRNNGLFIIYSSTTHQKAYQHLDNVSVPAFQRRVRKEILSATCFLHLSHFQESLWFSCMTYTDFWQIHDHFWSQLIMKHFWNITYKTTLEYKLVEISVLLNLRLV